MHTQIKKSAGEFGKLALITGILWALVIVSFPSQVKAALSTSINSISLNTTSNPVPVFNFCVTWTNTDNVKTYFGYRLTDSSGSTPSNGYQSGSDNAPSITWCNGGSQLNWNTSYSVKAWQNKTDLSESGPVAATYSFSTGAAPVATTTTAAPTTTTAAPTTTTAATTTTTIITTTTVRATTTTAPSSSTKAWSNAPEPSGTGNVMWAEIYQTPEGSDYGKITSYACGSKTQYGINGSTGGQNLGGGDRLGTRYIYFADSCGVSQAPSNSAFNTSTYVFTLANGYTRYAGVLIAPSSNTTTTTTATTSSTSTSTTTTTTTSTTVPKTVTTKAPNVTTPTVTTPKSGGTASTVPSSRPEPPVAPQASLLGASAVRVNWSDASSNETGFIIQRSDRPVGAGVSTAMWPYKTSANSTSYEFSGLAAGSQVCFAVASFNSTGASKFSDWACMNLANPGADVTPPPDATLTCDGEVVENATKKTEFKIFTGAANAGKLLQFEFYEKGKWSTLGKARVDASGSASVKVKSSPVGKIGQYPIRATQGSRFICEGDLTVAKLIRSYRKK